MGADDDRGLRDRVSARGEEAIGDLAQVLLENPLLNQALATALGAGEKAVEVQRSAMGALNLPAASDVDRLERRVRSVSERVEAIEDRIDDLAREVAQLRKQAAGGQPRVDAEEPSAAS